MVRVWYFFSKGADTENNENCQTQLEACHPDLREFHIPDAYRPINESKFEDTVIRVAVLFFCLKLNCAKPAVFKKCTLVSTAQSSNGLSHTV
jgi:hypothetical protein